MTPKSRREGPGAQHPMDRLQTSWRGNDSCAGVGRHLSGSMDRRSSLDHAPAKLRAVYASWLPSSKEILQGPVTRRPHLSPPQRAALESARKGSSTEEGASRGPRRDL